MIASVLIDTYNHQEYIAEAINSVLAQKNVDFTRIEIIVVDDGSTDSTGEIARSFGNVLRYYKKPNGGQASAFNYGIPLCRGEIICFLDGDDWWHPIKLQKIVDGFVESETTVGIGHGFIEIDEIVGDSLVLGPSSVTRVEISSRESVALFHKFACCLGTSRLAIRRWAALSLLPVPETLSFEADEYLFTLLPTLGEVIVLPEALTYYRIHGRNLYQDSRSLQRSHKDDARLLKRAAIYECLSSVLPIELQKRGCEKYLVDLVLGPVQVQSSRLRLSTQGGSSLANFRSEFRAAKISGLRTGNLSKSVLLLSLGLTLILPPKLYFRIRQRYSNFLKRARNRWPSPRLNGAD
jgi:glycosyltransferase involved in cell wall biosynthesis